MAKTEPNRVAQIVTTSQIYQTAGMKKAKRLFPSVSL